MHKLLLVALFCAVAVMAPVAQAENTGEPVVSEVAADPTEDQGLGALIKENPGKSFGIAVCGVAIWLFPPAAAWCAGGLIGGATVDAASEGDGEEAG